MFEVNPNRVYTFEYEVNEGDWISVTFDFPYAEDMDYTKMRELLKDIPEFKKNEKVKKLASGKTLTKEEAEVLAESKSVGIYYNTLRKSLVDCSGFGHKGEELKIKDAHGNINESNQKCIFEFVKKTVGLFEKVSLAFAGELDEGNVKIGLQPVSSSDGVQASASDAD